uniref:Uncharacterized protein LOC104219182 n=1 Tax=Nicotiana sylvestris TaxID=4096 RepID=A0A1U7VJ61_NICSY|nr:PREDICTED: uncharacterized protein LOC104219182 [Nicotiana sylvestris]
MGFPEAFIGLIFDLIGNNWYSVLINGQPNGFFKSSRGVKQGDPLSPTLFILAVEALSRGLNSLHTNLYLCSFGMPKWSPKINHLSYADDTIIFCSSNETSLRLVMEVLKAYESSSGQLVNKAKSAIYLHHLTDNEVINKVERITGIPRQCFPMTYLGCPIFYARRRGDYYQGLITKVKDKLQSWKGKLLSVGGRVVLIANVLTKPSLWSAFISQKYCKKLNAVIVPWKGGSHMWRKMLECRDLIEHQIYWKLRMGSALFWFDNWTEMGALNFQVPVDFGIDEDIHNVNDMVENGMWNVDKMFESLPEGLAHHIAQNIRPPTESSQLDTPFWMFETRGHFTVKSAWDYVSSTVQALVQLKKPGLRVPQKWLDLLTMMEQYTPRLKYDKVLWEFPSRGWIKVNTDRACRGNPGRISIGFCIRDEVGDLIYAEGREIYEGTNNESEAVAIVEALKMCKNLNYFQIWLQTDSMLLKNIIEESWKPPWYVTEHVEEILRLKEQSIIKVTHIFKEGNTLVDRLANYALDEGNTECHGFWDMDSIGRRIINEDKMQCPYIRVKVARN